MWQSEWAWWLQPCSSARSLMRDCKGQFRPSTQNDAPRRVRWGPSRAYWGGALPVGDRLLFTVSLPLLAVGLISANVFNHLSAAALSFAAFFLTVMTNIALAARTYPTDQFMGPFD